MYKKIYTSMRRLAVFMAVFITLIAYFSASGILVEKNKDALEAQAQIFASVLQTTEDFSALQTQGLRVRVLAPEGDVLLDNHVHADVQESDLYTHTQMLADGRILQVSMTQKALYMDTIWLVLPMFVALLLAYIAAIAIALRVADRIVAPIEKIDPFDIQYDKTYAELVPLLRRISAQRREIQRQSDRVERQNLRFRAIGEQMTDGLVLLGRSKKIIMVNGAALSAFGALETDVLGQNFLQLCRDVEMCDSLDKAWEGQRYQTERMLDGRPFELYCSPILQEGLVTGVLLMLFDVSEKRETEQIRREFTANVSHELKTPLTTVLGYAQMMNNQLADASKVPELSAKIEKEATRLLHLIEDIIELSKLDEMREPPQKTTVSLEAVALEVVDSLADKAKRRGVTLSVSGEGASIEGNLRQVTELLYNLCDNAIKYNRENGSVKIVLSGKSVCVSDTGIGIAPQYMERIFERFFRVDKNRSKTAGGTGLGLSIVKHIAQAHGAQISVESTPGEGTSFTVRFEK